MEKYFAVITTIQKPTLSMQQLLSKLNESNIDLVVAGDRKGPEEFPGKGVHFLSIEQQLDLGFDIAKHLPENHYARKNIGYLYAISQGATCIYETDDDNAPQDNWIPRIKKIIGHKILETGWVNVYRNFTSENIWPRGFPLDEIQHSFKAVPKVETNTSKIIAPIQQGLANNSPDVDALWRLVLDKPFTFNDGASIHLSPHAWSPFNSQSTWWWPEVYPLLYLPSYCSFRMTDIWRSFIAQRCLWELGYGLVFHSPEVVQERNPHDLMSDFNDELPGYQRNRELVEILEEFDLNSGVKSTVANLRTCYEGLIKYGFLPARELTLVNLWLEDLNKIGDVEDYVS